MPLVAWGVLGYAAGLAMGFGGIVHLGGSATLPGAATLALSAVALASCAALVPLPASSQRWSVASLALTLAAGVWQGTGARADDRWCAERARREGRALLRLVTDVSGERAGWGVIDAGGCGVRVRVRGRPAAPLPAGMVVDVRGTFARSDRLLEVRDARFAPQRAPSLPWRWRRWAAGRIDALYGNDAPLARALLLADARDIDRDVRDRFADAGIIHMLSVSGLHVGIIAGAVRTLARSALLGPMVGDLLSLAVTAAFVLFIGAPPPAVRSAVMVALVVAARLRQRPTSTWGVWAVSCAVPLVEPRVVLDLGWQLSAVGMAGLLASERPAAWAARRLRAERGWRRTLVASMVATTVASAATAPLVAWVFGRVSIAAVVTNAVAAPLFEVAQPLLFASMLLLPFAPVASLVAEAARSAMWAIDLVARAGAALPLAAVRAEPDLATAAWLAVAAAAGMVALVGRWWRRPLVVSLGALALATWWPVMRPGPGRLELHVLDVGQGDALAIRSPRGRWFLVDAGGAWRSGDAGARTVWPYLRRLGGDVVYLAVTHPHLDHVGGAATLVERAGVDTVWDGAYVQPGEAYRALLEGARQRAWRHVAAGDSASLDGVAIRVLAPDSAWMAGLDDPNAASVVLAVDFGRARFLLTGDAEALEEGWLVSRHGGALRADVLKVGHHGSAASSTASFLDAVRPRVAVVSVGAGNRYGHPAPGVLQAFDARGTHLLRTDDDGTIVIATDGAWIDVRADAGRWRYRASARCDGLLTPPSVGCR